MFAPDQHAAAAEVARVTRPGGRLALLNWHRDEGAEILAGGAPVKDWLRGDGGESEAVVAMTVDAPARDDYREAAVETKSHTKAYGLSAGAPAGAGCCSQTEQRSCCDPEVKAGCCGAPSEEGCGCR